VPKTLRPLSQSELAKLQPAEFIHWLKTCPDEKLVLRTVQNLRRGFARNDPIIARLYGLPVPKKRGRPLTRPLDPPASGPKPRGRPKERWATDAYSPLSIVIAIAIERRLLSKREFTDILIEEGVIPERSDTSDSSPYHYLKRLAKVGQENLRLHPENRQYHPKTKSRLIADIKQVAAEYLQFSKS